MESDVDIRIRLREAARFHAETRRATADVDALGNAAARANRKSKKGAVGLDELKKSAKGLQGLFKPALIVAGVGLLAQMFTTASAGAVGLLGALAPVSGLVLALPAAFMLAAQGAGVLKLGLSGVGGALGGLNGQINPKKFAALSKPGQDFVLTLNSMKGPIRELQRRVQDGLLPGLTKGLKAAMPALHALMGPLAKTGSVMGGIGARLGHLVGSRGFAKDLGDQARFNNVQLGRLGVAGVHIVDVFRQLMVAARPLVSWIVRLAGGWAANADKAATAGRANGKLAGMFKTIQHVTGSVLHILGDVGHTIFNIGNLGRKHLGESLLGSLVKGSAALRKWTESGPGIQKISRFFEQAKPVVYAFAELIKTAVRELFKLGTGGSGGLTSFFTQLRTEVLPEMTWLSKNLITLFGFISRNIPGGSWLLTIGYLLAKLNIAGPLAKALYGVTLKPLVMRAGAILGAAFASSFETVSLALMYGVDWVAGIAGVAGLSKFAAAGKLAGLAFEGAFILALALIAYEIGVKLGQAFKNLHFHFDLKRVLKGESPIWITVDQPKSLAARATENDSRLLKAGMKSLPGALQPKGHPKLAMGGVIGREGLVEVGERGPELLFLPRAAAVTPFPSLSSPVVAKVSRSGSTPGWGAPPIHIQVHSQLRMMDGKPVAESTSEVVAVHRALQ